MSRKLLCHFLICTEAPASQQIAQNVLDAVRYKHMIREHYQFSYLDLLRDYCNWETFQAQCKPGNVILITAASYGRMKFGRCVQKLYDEHGKHAMIGCQENIIRYALQEIKLG